MSFVLNAEKSAVAERLEHGSPLSGNQEATLAQLLAFLECVSQERGSDPFAMRFALLATLGDHRADLDTSWFIATRCSNGGAIELPTPDDPLKATLLVLVRDMYPLFLLPPAEEPYRNFVGWEVFVPLLRHPHREEFDHAVMADPALALLFPAASNDSEPLGSAYSTTGSGGTFQLGQFADMFLRTAWQFISYRITEPSLYQVADETLSLVDVVRDAVQGNPLSVPVLIGITGLRLPAGFSPLELPWGRLREVSEADKRFFPPDLSGGLTTITEDGTQIEIDYAGDLVMELDVPYSIKLGEHDLSVKTWPIRPIAGEIVERYLETLRLALLLSSERTPLPVAVGT